MLPNTMGNILRTYGKLSMEEYGPLSHSLNRFFSQSKILCTLVSIGTLIFECIMIPAALFLPQPLRLSMVFH